MLLRHALGKIDRHLGVNSAPVLPPPGPSFRNAHHGQVQHLLQAVIGGENGLSLGHLNSHAQDIFPAIQILKKAVYIAIGVNLDGR